MTAHLTTIPLLLDQESMQELHSSYCQPSYEQEEANEGKFIGLLLTYFFRSRPEKPVLLSTRYLNVFLVS